jgi:beta-glucosidase
VAAGLLDEATVDLSLSRLFTLQFKLGLFDPPNVYDQIPITVVDSDDHRQLAAQMARGMH